MRLSVIVIILALAISGCATPKARRESAYRSDQEWKLSRATSLMQEGNRAAAAQVLTHITTEPAVPGVTDEALFRLGLLHLRPDLGVDGMTESEKELKRLIKEFPKGAWAPMAEKLVALIASVQETQKRENRVKRSLSILTQENSRLKELNNALTKDNNEFRQSIQKLKTLELELGKGSKGR
jgi:outer membrane protein assembly factor BamD (BamD/ComL family)